MLPENGTANEAKMELIQIATRASRIQIALVALFCSVGFALIVVLIFGMVRLQDFAQTNRDLNQQNARLLENRQHNDELGIKAVRCVLDQFALHRITNQEFHDHLAESLHVPTTPISPLPPLPTDQQVADDCGLFYRR